MHSNSALLTRLDTRLPTHHTRFSVRGDALALAIALAVALVGFVPAVALGVRWLGLPIPLPSLLATGVILVAYTAAVVLLRRPVVGTVSALVVLSMFGANVPLPGIGGIPGAPAPGLWLFEIPLLAGLVIAAYQRWDRNLTLTRTHYAFAGFVGWAFLAAVLGAGPRLDAGVLFARHFLMALVVFVFVAATVERDVLSLRTVTVLFVVAVLAQIAFVIAQLVHGEPFGLSRLGESERLPERFITIAGLRVRTGALLSGLAGGANQIAALSLLAAPLAALYAILGRARVRTRAAAGVVTIVLFTIIRLTMKDSARGAALLALVAVVAAVALSMWRQSPRQLSALKQRLVAVVAIFGVALGALLYPSKEFGRGVSIPTNAKRSGGGGSGGGGSASSDAGMTANGGASATPDLSALNGLHLPFFNLQTLGVRAKQYVAAFDAFIHHPVFGLGGANFPFISVTRYGLRRPDRWSRPVGLPIHNGYLAVLVGTGLPGFLLFCATLVGILWAGVGLVRRGAVPAWLGYGLLAGFFAYMAFLFWDVTLSTPTGTIPFFILAGALVGAYSRQSAQQVDNPSATHERNG